MPRQRCRERAVLVVAVLRGRSGLGRIGDQGVGIVRLDLGKPAPDRAQRHRAAHGLGERIVAAGIEDHQPQLLGGLDRKQHALQRERLVVHVVVALEFGIHGNQIIGAVHLDAVAGIIDHGDLGIRRAVGEIAQHPPRVQRAEILLRHHDVEAGLLEGIGHQRRVVHGIGEPRHVLVGRIAEHQRHALAGKSRGAGEQQQGGEEDFVKAKLMMASPKRRPYPLTNILAKLRFECVVRQITKELPHEKRNRIPEGAPDVRSRQQALLVRPLRNLRFPFKITSKTVPI